MMKKLILTLAIMATIHSAFADITLPAPATGGGLPTNQALAERRSCREYDSSRQLSLQTVADLLWATCGINRPEEGLRTNPTGRNCQEIDAYWFDSTGIYLYDFKNNTLKQVATGDHRKLLAGTEAFNQEFVLEAPGAILLTIDMNKLPEGTRDMGMIDAGIACENINIFCAAHGLATVPRMTMDGAAISALLSLPTTVIPILNNPVGYAR